MFMNAEIDVQTKNVWVLPTDAVVSYENKQYIFFVKNKNEFEMLEITTGLTENGFTEIIVTDPTMIQRTIFVMKGSYSLLMKIESCLICKSLISLNYVLIHDLMFQSNKSKLIKSFFQKTLTHNNWTINDYLQHKSVI